jgi:hypothetical protein
MKNKLFLTLGVLGLALSNSAFAAGLTAPTIDTTDFMTVAGAVIVALGVMWAIKKALGLIRV